MYLFHPGLNKSPLHTGRPVLFHSILLLYQVHSLQSINRKKYAISHTGKMKVKFASGVQQLCQIFFRRGNLADIIVLY